MGGRGGGERGRGAFSRERQRKVCDRLASWGGEGRGRGEEGRRGGGGEGEVRGGGGPSPERETEKGM